MLGTGRPVEQGGMMRHDENAGVRLVALEGGHLLAQPVQVLGVRGIVCIDGPVLDFFEVADHGAHGGRRGLGDV